MRKIINLTVEILVRSKTECDAGCQFFVFGGAYNAQFHCALFQTKLKVKNGGVYRCRKCKDTKEIE